LFYRHDAAGTPLSIWGYSQSAGLPAVPAPTLIVNEGDTINMIVYN
jgi:FtsP/CotA-like multicopper oxidase with cupredoxin domain